MNKKLRYVIILFSIFICVALTVTNMLFLYYLMKGIKYDSSHRTMLLESNMVYNLYKKKIEDIEKKFASFKKMNGGVLRDKDRLNEKERSDLSIVLTIGSIYYKEIDSDLFLANITAESEWNKKAFSEVGARGICQIMPRTFDYVNQEKLDKFGKYNIYDVYHNSEVSMRHLSFIYKFLESKINRPPTVIEISWAYNAGQNLVLDAILTGSPEKYLPQETIYHAQKVMYYYTNYQNEKYDIWWYKRTQEETNK